ncbi:MAG: hypothetical protein UT36_C0009G0007 [Candidatus Peregrinibacteria bacterium GW2011_GWF2_39_17]|nr:MAG: hypothetical protein UT36_C0009G0007 [Candidatus Peregrinibacteria bacterium GW2011_GWF2_39_17]HCW32748.1 hypothetical protein [Candidatus Peregrinibacteria bacterium]
MKPNSYSKVYLLALLEEPMLNSPVMILHEPKSDRILPIWIGELEARAIAVAFQGIETERPLTHTLLKNTILGLGAKLNRVVIEKLAGGTYLAQIWIMKAKQRKSVLIDSRPSDAVAMALETGRPIYVAKAILDAVGQVNPFPSSQLKNPSFTPEEVQRLRNLLQKAREREEE